jgi:hypothetical protein
LNKPGWSELSGVRGSRTMYVMFIVDLLLLSECSTSNVSHLLVHCNIKRRVNNPRVDGGTLPFKNGMVPEKAPFGTDRRPAR